MKKWIEIARTGTFTDSLGRPQTFTGSDLAEIARAFDPKKRDCALCIGHPKADNAPAFGWLSAIKAENGKLFAQFAQVPAKVSEMVKNGHYRHVSMSLMPDRKTLRHVALLGAAQPAIDGLEPLEGSALYAGNVLAVGNAVELGGDSEAITINFTMGDNMPQDDLQREEGNALVIGALKERIASLEKENRTLREEAKGHKADKDKAETEKRQAREKEAKTASDFSAYREKIENEKREARVSALVKSGRITPAEKGGVLEFAAALAGKGNIEFAAARGAPSTSGAKEEISLEEKYLRELEARTPDERQITFSAPPLHSQNENGDNFNPAEMAAML